MNMRQFVATVVTSLHFFGFSFAQANMKYLPYVECESMNPQLRPRIALKVYPSSEVGKYNLEISRFSSDTRAPSILRTRVAGEMSAKHFAFTIGSPENTLTGQRVNAFDFLAVLYMYGEPGHFLRCK